MAVSASSRAAERRKPARRRRACHQRASIAAATTHPKAAITRVGTIDTGAAGSRIGCRLSSSLATSAIDLLQHLDAVLGPDFRREERRLGAEPAQRGDTILRRHPLPRRIDTQPSPSHPLLS